MIDPFNTTLVCWRNQPLTLSVLIYAQRFQPFNLSDYNTKASIVWMDETLDYEDEPGEIGCHRKTESVGAVLLTQDNPSISPDSTVATFTFPGQQTGQLRAGYAKYRWFVQTFSSSGSSGQATIMDPHGDYELHITPSLMATKVPTNFQGGVVLAGPLVVKDSPGFGTI